VDYSTIDLSIQEVKTLTEEPAVQRTYWQEVGDGLKSTLKGMGSFFKWLLKAFIAASPVLLLLAVVAVAVVIIVKLALKRKKK
jgi:hypothetical protein